MSQPLFFLSQQQQQHRQQTEQTLGNQEWSTTMDIVVDNCASAPYAGTISWTSVSSSSSPLSPFDPPKFSFRHRVLANQASATSEECTVAWGRFLKLQQIIAVGVQKYGH